MTDEEFEVVTQAVMELEQFGADMDQAPLPPGTTFRDVSKNVDALHTMRVNATAAYNALAKRAGGKAAARPLHDE